MALPQSPILYQNPTKTTFLIDIPLSIALSQCLSSPSPSTILCPSNPSRSLLSVAPRTTPYPSTEPKSATALAKLKAQLATELQDEELHRVYAELATEALKEVKEAVGEGGEFCLPRVTREGMEKAGKKRRCEGDDGGLGSEGNTLLEEHGTVFHYNRRPSPQIFNFPERATTSTTSTINSANLGYILPPRSAFFLSSLSSASDFRTHARKIISHPSEPASHKGRFHFVLLDPPWSNRSATRKSSYATVSNLGLLKRMLALTDLDMHIREGGFVGIWVTNRSSCRNLVIGNGGLFEMWGLESVEEWLWVKVTGKGEALTAIDGIWRKPYEVCLIGKKISYSSTNEEPPTSLKRRVIIGAPDLHSRKPCLKWLVEDLLLPDTTAKTNLWGLEVFARYCVAEWLAWGDEATLFNQNDWWSS